MRLTASVRVWLYVSSDTSLGDRADIDRIAEPLGRLWTSLGARAAGRASGRDRGREPHRSRRAPRPARDLTRSALSADRDHHRRLRIARSRGHESERTELMEVIDGEGIRLAKLVDDLLDLSKIQAGAAFRGGLVRPARRRGLSVGSSARSHPIEFALAVDLPLVRADPAQLERVFSTCSRTRSSSPPTASPVRVSGGAAVGRVTVRLQMRTRRERSG